MPLSKFNKKTLLYKIKGRHAELTLSFPIDKKTLNNIYSISRNFLSHSTRSECGKYDMNI